MGNTTETWMLAKLATWPTAAEAIAGAAARGRDPAVVELTARSMAWPEDDPDPPARAFKILITIGLLPRPKRQCRVLKRVYRKADRLYGDAQLGMEAAAEIRGVAHVRRVLMDWAVEISEALGFKPEEMVEAIDALEPPAPPN